MFEDDLPPSLEKERKRKLKDKKYVEVSLEEYIDLKSSKNFWFSMFWAAIGVMLTIGFIL